MAGGTGNLILKRGTTIPESALLPKAMPAVQLVNISPVNTSGGTPEYAYVNFPNRLWIGMEGLTCDSGGFTGYETGSGSSGGGNLGSVLPCSSLGTQDLNRPLWMGAEIRAFVEVYEDETDVVPIILKADWANPSDVILVTQKSIFEWAEARFTKGGNSVVRLVETGSPNIDYIELQAPADVVDNNYILILPSNLPAEPQAGKVLTISSVAGNAATLTWSDAGAASSATVAETVTLEATNSTDATHYITFVDTATGNEVVRTDTSLTYNPSSNTLTATTFSGNATTATSATTATTATNANNINISATTSTDTSTSIVLVGAQTTGNQLPFIDSGLAYNANTDLLVVGSATTGGVTTGVVTTTQITRSNNTIEINAAGGSGTVIRGSQTVIGTDTRPVLTVMPETQGGSNDQFVKIEGGDLYLGNKTITDAGAPSAVNIIFDGATISGTTNRTTLTVVEPTQANTITLPNTSGTVAIVAGNTTEVQFNTSGVLDSDPNFTFTKSGNGTLNLAGTLALNGGSMTTSAANVDLFTGMTSGNITVGGAGSTTVIGGNLTVSGTTTTVNTETINLADNIITLNSNAPDATTSTESAGIEIKRGTSASPAQPTVALRWNENNSGSYYGTDRWQITNDGTNYYNIIAADYYSGDTTSSAPLGTQYIHTLDVKNLTMSGTWTLGANITTDVNLSNGGLILPHTTDVGAESDETQEGRVYWETDVDLMTVGTGTGYKTMVDTDSSQSLSNKTLTAPKIVNNGFIADANGNEQIVFVTTSSAVNEITITNAATGSSPLIASSGGNTNIDLRLQGKGTGTVVIDDSAINTSNAIFSVFDSTASSISAFGAATTLGIGASSGTASINNTTVTAPNATTISGAAATTLSLSTTPTGAATINIGTGANTTGTKAINIGTAGASGGTTTVTIGSCLTGHTSSVVLGSSTGTSVVQVSNNGLIFKDTGNRITLSSASSIGANATHTLPNITSGNVVIAGTTNFNTSNYILMGGGSTTPSAFTDKDTVVVGGVRVNFQDSIPSNTRYPVPFLGSTRSTNNSAPSTFGTTTDGTYTDSYLYANLGAATATGTVTNYTTGLFYEVNDSEGTGVGTLFCDYIGATLDCGTYT